MTPRRLDPEVVDARLRSMEPLLARLAELRGVSGSRLADDLDLRLVAADIGVITAEPARRIAPSAGLRNLLTHRYGEVDHQRVADAVPGAVDDYTEYVTPRRLAGTWAGSYG